MPYTLDDMAAAQLAVEAAERRTENNRQNNPNRGRADLQRARSTLDMIVSDLRQRGIIPTPEPTAKQRLESSPQQSLSERAKPRGGRIRGQALPPTLC